MTETPTPACPEYAMLALHDDLMTLATDMSDTAHEVRTTAPFSGDASLLEFAAANTVVAADLVATGRWTIEAGLSWLEAGRAAIKRATR